VLGLFICENWANVDVRLCRCKAVLMYVCMYVCMYVYVHECKDGYGDRNESPLCWVCLFVRTGRMSM